MTLPRMILFALALLVPVVAVTLYVADLLAPVVDTRSMIAGAIAFSGYAAIGAVSGFVLGSRTPKGTDKYSIQRAGDRNAFKKRFAVMTLILMLTLFALNLVLVRDRMTFVQYELRVVAFLLLGGAIGFAARRLYDKKPEAKR